MFDEQITVSEPHSRVVDGQELVGVLFVSGNGKFYEFVDPQVHDEYAKFRDPRSGDTMVYSSTLDKSVKSVMGGHIRAKIPKGEWMEFRESYLNADSEQTEQWQQKWESLHKVERTELVTNDSSI